MIAYLDTENNKGLALALADEMADESDWMAWSTAISTCSAKTPTVTGGTWKLATKDEWDLMISAAGSSNALHDGFSSVGGTNMQWSSSNYYYWSSTESDSGRAWNYNFSGGSWYSDLKENCNYVRACLAFDFNTPVTKMADNWYMISRQTQTRQSDWTALSAGSTTGRTLGSADAVTYYYATGDLSFTNSTVGGSGLTIQGTVYLYIPSGTTLTCTGANASGQTGAGAGIELTQGNSLYLIGGGTLNANGGNAANGGNGGNGNDAEVTYDVSILGGSGGTGGNGGGGAGAGIGTRGGNGGTGGSGGQRNGSYGQETTQYGVDGSAGTAGSTAGAMGTLYVYQDLAPTMNVNGGNAGSNGSGGSRGKTASQHPGSNLYMASGGGGGGAGGFGGAASNIGTGGPGGGGGGGGAAGNVWWTVYSGTANKYHYAGAYGGKGGKNGNNSSAPDGADVELTNPKYADIQAGGLRDNASDYNDPDGYENGNGRHAGGAGGAAGSASTSGSAINLVDWPTSGAGTEESPYLINDANDWNSFTAKVNSGISYSDKVIKLTDNISVTTMAGLFQNEGNYQPFSGTFDGDGHTLTINVSNQSRFTAPFKCVSGATIKNLRTAGTIDGTGNADGKLLGGLVGISLGNNTITGCVSSVTLRTDYSNDAAMAGLVAATRGGSLTINACVFNGSLQGGATSSRCAGISGYEYIATTTIITNTLFAPTSITVPTNDGYTRTFTRDADATITKCYYTQPLGTVQGTQATVSTNAPGCLGNLIYDCSIVKAYQGAILFNGNYYYDARGITSTSTTLSTGTYTVYTDITIPSRITISGNVTLNLGEGTTLHAPKGIDLSYGNSLTINGPGTMTIDNCDDNMAGIGSSSMGSLTINSGVVNVKGGYSGAGIGGNRRGNGGYVIIHGGVVNAMGGQGGPGIGGGADFSINDSQNHPCGDVVITGGQVTAIGNKVYGIGPGAAHVGEYHNGTLQLSWTNPDDFVFISTASVSYTQRTLSSITFTNGKQFYLEHTAAIATESNLYGYKLLPYTGTLPSLAGTGTAEDPYLINNHDDWLLFYWYVNSGTNSYSGQYVKLMSDLTITTTIGLRDDKPFSGTFLGNGHTLTANLTGTIYDLDVNNERGTAPFHYIKNATIKDLTITGDTYSTSLYAGGLVGFADGTNLIEGCIVTSTLHLSNRHAGGIIAHGMNSTTTLRNCVFAGTITSYHENQLYDGKNVIEIGGIWGWNDDEATPTLQNCLEKGSFNNIKSMHPIGLQGDKGTITNCYYVNQQIDSPTNACTVSGAYKVEKSLSGLCKEITIKGVTVYSQSCTVSGVEANYVMTENPINVYPVMTDPSFGTTLNFDTDYTVTLDGEPVEALPISISTTGSHTLVFTGKGSYVGTKSVETYLINNINGTGSDTDPYIISNTDEWNTFAYFVNSGTNTYSGEYVKLTADISVTEMVGTSESNSFQGTFLGDGVHTLTFTKGTSESAFGEENCAPFRYVKNATIRDLKVAGYIYTSRKLAAGLVSRPYGTTNITNCQVSTVIYSSVNGDSAHGGIVAMPDGTLNIEGCAYTGRLLTNNGTTNCGGFMGWYNNATVSVTNSLYIPSGSIAEGWSAITNGVTFLRGGIPTINNCYYTEALGTEQGRFVYTTTTTAPVNLGILKAEYSMLTAYANGILFEGTYYVAQALNGAGTVGNPYIIATDDDWETFVYNVNNGFNNYNGEYVRLDESISVSTMVGTSDDRSFQGTFLGDGTHTLTFTKGTAESAFGEENCAPFRFVKNATIRDLKVTGDIYTSRKFAAGLVARNSGTTTITNCQIGTVIHSSVSGDGTHGGIVAMPAGSTTTNITGCVYNGRLLTTNGTQYCGGFVGWSGDNTVTVAHSLYAPDANIVVAAGETDIDNGATFVRGNKPTVEANCYYTEMMGSAQGTHAYALATAPANFGNLVQDYGMLQVYGNGILYDGTYYVAPATVSLVNNADNSTAISGANGYVADVTLTDRTLYKDGKWNTICLPFSLSAAQIAANTDFAGATLMTMDVTQKNGFDKEDGTLYLGFKSATAIEAGVPYLVKWTSGDDIINPVFQGVTISNSTAQTVESVTAGLEIVQMVGTYSPVSVTANDKSILFLGNANTLYYSTVDRQIRSCRAYFSVPYIHEHAGAMARAFALSFDGEETTGILEVSAKSNEVKDDVWYSLDGVRLSGKPTQRGMYINKGKKILVK